MFAVKGWSVSADKVRAERPKPAAATADGEPTKKSRKRKRQAQNVDSSNVADLWESVIDGRDDVPGSANTQGQPKDRKSRKDRKRPKWSEDKDPPENGAKSAEERRKKKTKMTGRGETTSKPEGKVARKDKKKAQKANEAPTLQDANDDTPTATANPTSSTTASGPPKLTPLQASMRDKLVSARFRHLNETLYTQPSADALALFAATPEMFSEYHEGFRRQVEVWPENPVAGYIADIRARARVRHPPKHKRGKASAAAEQTDAAINGNKTPPPPPQLDPLPRSRDTNVCTIADLGCGDARLAAALAADARRLQLALLSFDLASPHPRVTKADIANLPLASATVDVAVLCLALMGTNWVDFVDEAYRVLRWKGELWVAEIKSRFGAPGRKKSGVEHSVGKRRTKAGGGGSGAKDKGAGEETTTLLVEVDGVDDTRQQTDVSAFVSVLNKRGFLLARQDQGHGEEAVDLSNRMFVKMRFIKCAPATKGKNVREEKEEKSRFGGKLQTMAKKPKFIEDDVEVDEASVLKPCVYKLR